jgi:DNA ligase-associated metallophosphoesterase
MKEVFELRGEELWLLPQKAIYWPAKRCLFIADTHFGKVGHFRKNGIGLPDKAAFKNLQRLADLLTQSRPKAVYFLGDLFHSELNAEWLYFKEVLRKFPESEFHLVAGNHDILHHLSYQNAGLQYHKEGLALGPFWLSHHPLNAPEGAYNLAGHLHPGVRLKGQGKQNLRLPCFYFQKEGAILPAFGEFTGLSHVSPEKGETIFVVTTKAVVRIN